MRCIFLILFISTLNSFIYSQNNWNTQYFRCFGNNISIPLPPDFNTPKYFEYEEGSITNYSTTDTCVVSILCGELGELELDSSYHVTKTQTIVNGIKRIDYYSKSLNRYARKDYLSEYLIMYDRATIARKEELDRLFDFLEAK